MADGGDAKTPHITFTDALVSDPSRLIETHYDVLKQIARSRRRQSRNMTMLTTDILHESWLKLRDTSGWNNEQHFIRTVARAIRFVVIDQIREKMALKRGAGLANLSFDDLSTIIPDYRETPEEIMSIDRALQRLSLEQPRVAETVNLRYFGGLTERETADALSVSERTVRRDWVFAKAWLAVELAD